MGLTKKWLLFSVLAPALLAQAGTNLIRLETLLDQASVKTSSTTATQVAAAEPLVWQDFFSPKDNSWQLVRGRIGVRNGDLVVGGDGSTPVILAPKEPAIDWELYQAIEVRMSAQAGSEIKIKIGDFEAKQKLGAPGQYNVYHFDLNIEAPKGGRILGIMPTDSTTDSVAIHSIKLLPKNAEFVKPAGVSLTLGKSDEYRNAIYVRSPATLTFPVTVPAQGFLHLGMGVAAKGASVRFASR